MKILIVEDESGAALILRRTLEKCGHDVEVAVNGAIAWDILQKDNFSVVISDWMMPQMDGPALCRRIRARQESLYTYVILLTSRNDRSDRLEGLNSGADDFLAKPLGRGELFARLAIAERILAMQNELQQLNTHMAEKNQELSKIVSRLEEANLKLAEMATSDGLTRLKNHRFFQEMLTANFSFAQRQGLALSLILLDVDSFKSYNDTFGHPAGDDVLRQVSAMLSRNVREHDIAARYGGEEFTLLLPATPRIDAVVVAERMRREIEAYPWSLRPITVSIGVATFDAIPNLSGPISAVELLAQADMALYHSKRHGRNQVTHIREIPECPPEELTLPPTLIA